MAVKSKSRRSSKARRGAPKYTEEMKRDLVQTVLAADKAGQERPPIYAKFAEEWSGVLGTEITPKNVASCFQNYKAKFGGAGSTPAKAAPKAKAPAAKAAPKPAAKSKPKRRVTAPKIAKPAAPTLSALAQSVVSAEAELAEATEVLREAKKRHLAAERRIERVKKALA